MLWVYDSLSPFQKLHRLLRAKKFYKTLKLKLDKEQQRWLDLQPDTSPKKEYIEHEPDGSMAQRLLGGVLQVRYKFFNKDDNRKV
jgi:hypothetical protein